jgi:hypothetical protein
MHLSVQEFVPLFEYLIAFSYFFFGIFNPCFTMDKWVICESTAKTAAVTLVV